MEAQERQACRADNQIWNGAAQYGFSTDYRGFDPDGEASLYLNTVMGLTRKCYDFEALSHLFAALEAGHDGEEHAELLWMGLERTTWLKCRDTRPVLDSLRREHARRQLNQTFSPTSKLDGLKLGWFRRVLGLPSQESKWETEVLNALEFDPGWDEAAIRGQMEFLLSKYFGRHFRSELDRLAGSRVDLGFFAKLGNRSRAIRGLHVPGAGEGGGALLNGRPLLGWGQARTDSLRTYIADTFGASMLTPAELSQAEKVCCAGAHKNCILHFTRGDCPKTGTPSRERAALMAQGARNRKYYQENLAKNRLEIQRLAQQLQNTILLQQEDEGLRCRAGRLRPAVAWRGPAMGDDRVFDQQLPYIPGDLLVDILLDASASQNTRQEQLASQTYILTEALTRCRIPVRVMSYCSVSGCTVLREFRDYSETGRNDRIFDFASAGWNRDGLALRALNWRLKNGAGEKRLLIILTDANPNDDQRFAGAFGRDYSGKPALRDTAAEAAALRKSGNPPLCLFTGRQGDLSNARDIYGRDVVRLPAIGWFADTAGKIIQGKLRDLG